jgi:hypothetical protein
MRIMKLRDLFKFGRESAPLQPPPPLPPPLMTSRQANEMLIAAVEANDVQKAEMALKASGSANLMCKYRHYYFAHNDSGPRRVDQADDVPLLWLATINKNEPMVRLLLSHGAHVDAPYLGRSSLMHAVGEGKTSIVRALLDGGAVMRETSFPYTSAYEIASNAQYADILQMLCDEPARRKQAQLEAEQAAREAEEQARWRAQNPSEPVTDNDVVVMKPLTLKLGAGR